MLSGFAEGIKGIAMQPIQGAQKGGASGFFKVSRHEGAADMQGVGRGLLGIVVKPVTGIVDMTSSTVQAVNAAAQVMLYIIHGAFSPY
jgi:vacuolar protein sorting-associated protein 13A/C